MTDMPPARRAYLDHLCTLVREQRPFVCSEVAQATGRNPGAVRDMNARLIRSGLIEVEIRQIGRIFCNRITVIGLGATPWPDIPGAAAPDQRMREISRRAKAWINLNRWSVNQMVRAISLHAGVQFGHQTLAAILAGGECTDVTATKLSRFMTNYPHPPGGFEGWLQRWSASNERKIGDDEIRRRREALEREREERRRALLAAERRPWKRADNDDVHLDAATIAALSGGTIRSLRHG